MKRFVVLYFIFLALLFIVFYAPSSKISFLLNEGQTTLTLFFLDVFLDSSQLKGVDIWINPHYKIIITKACNGIIPILFLSASILAYPSRIGYKVIWIGIGYILFSIVNVGRILMVVYITQKGSGQADFYWSHDFIGNLLLVLTGLLLFVLFIKRSSVIKDL